MDSNIGSAIWRYSVTSLEEFLGSAPSNLRPEPAEVDTAHAARRELTVVATGHQLVGGVKGSIHEQSSSRMGAVTPLELVVFADRAAYRPQADIRAVDR
jgi:hypothetical protein